MEIKNNIVELTALYDRLNKTIQENITFINSASASVRDYTKAVNGVPSTYAKLLQDLADKNKKLNDTQQKTVTIEKEIEIQRKKSISTIATKNQRTAEEIVNQRALAKNADLHAKANSNLAGSYARLSAQEQIHAKKVQDLIARGKLATQTQRQFNQELKKAQKEFDLIRAKLLLADNATGRWSRTNERTIIGLRGLAGGVRQLMSAFGLYGGIFLFAQIMTSAFKTIKQFDKANADLAATMGLSRKEITALTNDQKRLGATTKFTATEVAGLQKEFAKLGFSQKEILNATEATLNLAAAVDTDLANAAMVAGSTLRGFGLDASEMGRVTDVMASSFTKSALDIENFRESMKYVAPIAAKTGVSVEFATAMLGKLADAGIKGSQAGTSLRRVLTEMAKTGKPAKEAFDQVAKSGISVTDAMDEVGRTAQTALLVLSDTKDEVLELSDALEDAGGAAQKMADEQLKSLDGQLTLLTSAWDGFILSLNKGDSAISRVLGNLVNLLRNSIEGFSFLMESDRDTANRQGEDIKSLKYKGMLNEIFKSNNNLKKEINQVNDLIAKQRQQLEKVPNDASAKQNLKNLEAQRLALENLIEVGREDIKSTAINTIPIISETIRKYNEEQIALEKKNELLKIEVDYYEQNSASAIKNADASKLANDELSSNKNRVLDLIRLTKSAEGELEAYRTSLDRISPKDLVITDEATGIGAKEKTKKSIDNVIASEYEYKKAILERIKAQKQSVKDNDDYLLDDRLQASKEYQKAEQDLILITYNHAIEMAESKKNIEIEKQNEALIEGTVTRENYARNIKEIEKQLAYDIGVINTDLGQTLEDVALKTFEFQKKLEEEKRFFVEKTAELRLKRSQDIALKISEDEKNTLIVREKAFIEYVSLLRKESDAKKIIELSNSTSIEQTNYIIEQYKDLNKEFDEMLDKGSPMAKNLEYWKEQSKEFVNSFKDGFLDEAGLGALEKFLDFDKNGLSTFDKLIMGAETFGEKFKVTFLAVTELAQEAFNKISEMSQKNFEEEYSRLEAQKENQLKFAGDSATAREEIERQYEERKKEIQNREAKRAKELAIFNAVINTAQAVTSALANYDYTSAILFGILGAAEIAYISSQNVPQYWTGTENAKEGWALTQERGAEVITDKSGKIKTLGNDKGAQMTYMSAGDKVYKSHEDYINKELSKNGVDPIGTYLNIAPEIKINNNSDISSIKKEISNLASAIKNKETVNISIDERGFVKRQGGREILNNRLTLKSKNV